MSTCVTRVATSLAGCPIQSATIQTHEMHTLLAGFSFTVVQDDDLASVATGLSAEFAEATRLHKNMRIATAERR